MPPTTVTSTAPATAGSRRLVPSHVSPMPTLRPSTAWPMTYARKPVRATVEMSEPRPGRYVPASP